ncbi:hypothetical protein HOU95_gp077 [Streptomyces phage Hiyaa]|uniref:Lipoprotein n=1 Tax=Streptomyces phage Hiyaa TaxID=2499072 RepID=A0A3S9U8Y9_9CAUD|nr:hypothetical protein HOU95_gp077 [Streptomyces phage Hiyaa]AZS06730.1 hypothetical protein SEA_HIYAA_91 [Streptomyces phage Hiyaa]
MNRKTSAAVAGTATALVLGLVGCGGSGEPSTVDGLRDDFKTKAAVAEVAHFETKPKTKRVCAAKNNKGTCTRYEDRPNGTKRVKVVDKPGKPALYCVELDDVNGSKSDDDAWYTVTLATYAKVSGQDEGSKVKNMTFLHPGCGSDKQRPPHPVTRVGGRCLSEPQPGWYPW